MSHTKTPWALSPDCSTLIENDDLEQCGEYIACAETKADARRIVACVNRLAAFTTEQIEDLGYDLFADVRPRYEDAMRDLCKALDQRDRAERALTRAGWTYTEGAEEWKPPLGPSASPLLEKIEQLTAQRDQLLAALEGIKELMGYEWLRPEFEQADAAIKAAKGI